MTGEIHAHTREIHLPHASVWQNLLWTSDWHLGSSRFDRHKFTSTMDKAKRLNARVTCLGDVFDGILPSDHKRFQPDALCPQLQGRKDILNAALDYAVELLTPYAHLIDVITVGNHDTAITRHHSIAVMPLLLDALNALPNVNIHHGGARGWLRYRFSRGKSKASTALTCYLFHGSSYAPVTKGTIEWARVMQWAHCCDIIASGHNHERMIADNEHAYVNHQGRVVVRTCKCIRCGGFQRFLCAGGEDYDYADMNNLGPKPIGSVFTRATVVSRGDGKDDLVQEDGPSD